MNDYFNPAPDVPTNYTLARAGEIKQQFLAIGAAFDKLPAVRVLQENRIGFVIATGTNNLAAALPVDPEDYQNGLSLAVRVANTNTGPATFNLNGLGAVAIKNRSGADIGAGAMVAGDIARLVYDNGVFHLLNDGTEKAAAAGSATAAAASAAAAASSASDAATSAGAAAGSASAAGTSATNAANSASAASTSATNAANSATAASNSATAANTSKNAAATSATAAASSATSAAGSETNAANSASGAAASATSASNSATAASSAQTAAEAARDQALAAFDSFDDKYLGEKATDPTTDNDGDPLQAGMLYFNTTTDAMMVYTGTAWVAAYVSGGTFLPLSGGTMTGLLTLAADLGLVLTPGDAPASPADGQEWRETGKKMLRIGGTSYEVSLLNRSQSDSNKAFTSSTWSGGTISGASISAGSFTGYTEIGPAPTTGTALSPNLANGTLFRLITNGNATITLPTPASGKSFTVVVEYGGTHTLTWAGGTRKWVDGTVPTPTSTNGKIDVFTFVCLDGSNWLAFVSGQNL